MKKASLQWWLQPRETIQYEVDSAEAMENLLVFAPRDRAQDYHTSPVGHATCKRIGGPLEQGHEKCGVWRTQSSRGVWDLENGKSFTGAKG